MREMEQLTVLTYSYVPDVVARRDPHREQHLALLAAHGCVIGGATGDPPHGALLAFPTQAQALAFRDADPYRAAGLVTDDRIEPWAIGVGGAG